MKRRLRIQSAAMLLGSLVVVAATFGQDVSLGALALICAGLATMAIADGWLINRYEATRRALVEVVRDCGGEGDRGYGRADYFEDLVGLVPDDVLAEAFPTADEGAEK